MKIKEIFENKEEENILKFIQIKCKPWLDETSNGQYFVYRGMGSPLSRTHSASVLEIPKNREPMTSRILSQILINKVLNKKKLVANRSNSIFVTGDQEMADPYGEVYVCIPVGRFYYTWSSEFNDLYLHFGTEHDLSRVVKFKSTKKAQLLKQKYQEIFDTRNEQRLIEDILWKSKEHNAHSIKSLELFEFDYNNSKIIKAEKSFHGDDGSLIPAIKSGHEILIHAKKALYIDVDLYKSIMSRL